MRRLQKGISISFEGIFGAGKTTTVRRLSQMINTSIVSLWSGHGFHYSLRRGVERNTSIEEWCRYRAQVFHDLERYCDIMLLEKSTFSDFSNLCFRKKLVSQDQLLDLSMGWWPDLTIVIMTPVAICSERIIARGDKHRAGIDDLGQFYQSIEQTTSFLAPHLGERLYIAQSGEVAYQKGLETLKKGDRDWTTLE